MKKLLLFAALLFGIAALSLAGWRDDRIKFVDFQDANGHHVFALEKPVSRGDALELRGSMFDVAKREALNW